MRDQRSKFGVGLTQFNGREFAMDYGGVILAPDVPPDLVIGQVGPVAFENIDNGVPRIGILLHPTSRLEFADADPDAVAGGCDYFRWPRFFARAFGHDRRLIPARPRGFEAWAGSGVDVGADGFTKLARFKAAHL
ncbi:MAG: hypothetical protein V4657_09290 [Pseudomonadota bacterium]